MLNDKERASFEAIRKRSLGVENSIEVHRQALRHAEDDRLQVIAAYNGMRLAAFQREMETRGVVCCNADLSPSPYCETLVSRDFATMFFVERGDVRTYGSDFSRGDVFEETRKLHLVCPECAQKMRDFHGSKGTFQKHVNRTPFFNAFEVKCKPDGFYARKFGKEIKLSDDEVASMPPLSESFVDHYAQEWNLPPKLEIARDGNIVIPEFDLVLAV